MGGTAGILSPVPCNVMYMGRDFFSCRQSEHKILAGKLAFTDKILCERAHDRAPLARGEWEARSASLHGRKMQKANARRPKQLCCEVSGEARSAGLHGRGGFCK